MTSRSLCAAALAAATVGSLCVPAPAHAQSASEGSLAPGPGRPLDPSEVAGRPVRAVELRGLSRLSPHYLRSKVRTRVGERFDPEVLAADVARLHALGALRSEAGLEVEVIAEAEGVRVVFHLAERPRIGRIVVRGRDALALDQIAERTLSVRDAPLDELVAAADADRIRALYHAEGHIHASVRHEVRPTAPGEADLVFVVEEGPRVQVEEIVFEGAHAFEPGELREAIETSEAFFFGLIDPGRLDRTRLQTDVDRLLAFYRRHGYLDARVHAGALAFCDPERTAARVTFHLVEGPRYLVGDVALRGVTVFDPAELRALVPLRTGDHFDGGALERGIAAIRRRYGERSYILAEPRIETRYERDANRVHLTIALEEGEPVVIDRVIIVGNDLTRDEVIRREVEVLPGRPFDVAAAERSIARLDRRRWFDDLRVRFEDAATPGRKDMVIDVKEARTGSVLIGGGVSSEGGWFGTFSVTERNFDITRLPRSLDDLREWRAFKGGGQLFSIDLQPGNEMSRYRVRFVEPHLFGTPFSLHLDGYRTGRVFDDWTETRKGGRIGIGYQVFDGATVRLDYRFERVRVHDIDADAIPDVFRVAGDNDLSSVILSFEIDRNVIDRRFVAHDGWGLRAAIERAGRPLGGDLDFTRATLDGNWQQTLFEFPEGYRHVLAARASVGWIGAHGRTDEVPIFERFFAGGPGSIRGFELRGIGPRFAGEPTGGGFLARASLEYSFPILPGDILRGVLFADAANLVTDVDDFLLRDGLERDGVRVSAGFGLRLAVPYFAAPIRLDFGFPIVKMRDDEERVFSFGVSIGF